MPATSQELLDATACFCFQIGAVQRLRIAFLLRSVIAIAPATDVSPEALSEAGACYLCLPGISKADAIELVLIDLIGQQGGSGAQLFHGSGPPVIPPTAPLLDAIYLDNDENSASYGTKWSWDVDNAVWI